MTKKYQNDEIDMPDALGIAVPERVSVAMSEIAGSMREGLLALAVGAGLQVMQVLMEADVTALAGPRGRHDPDRTAVRHGCERGSVTLGGRRVPVARPRVRAADGSAELPVPAYELFNGTEVLGAMAMERMLAGLSTRRCPVGLEPVGEQVTAAASATSKSAVSRKLVAMTETALAELLAADLSALGLVALMVDGVHFGESVCILALGIDLDGTKHPLALVEGSTENATAVTDLLTGLRDRGLDVTRPILVGIDGAKALRKAVIDVFDHQLRDVATAARQWQVAGTSAARDAFAVACATVADAVDAHTVEEERTLPPMLGEHLRLGDWAAIARSSHCRLRAGAAAGLGLALENSCAGDRARLLEGLPRLVRLAWRTYGGRHYRSAVVRLRGAPPAG